MKDTQKALIKSPQSFIRIDKNIAMFGVDLINSYGKQAQLILDVLLYSALKQQRELFNYGVLDVRDFAKNQGYSPSNLLRTVKDPIQKDYHKFPEGKRFVNVIENALYTMGKQNLTFSKLVRDYSSGEDISKVEFYQLLKGLDKHVSFKRKDQFYYTYEITEIFQNHINKFFTHIDPEVSKRLRKNNGMFLYLNLISLRDTVLSKQEIATPVFNDMINIAGIDIKRPSDQKFKLDQKLKLIKELTHLNFEHEFVNVSGKYNYGLKIEFEAAAELPSSKETLQEALRNDLALNLKSYFIGKYCADEKFSKEKFTRWFYDEKFDYEEKMNFYFMSHHKILRTKSLEQSEDYCRSDARNFFRNCVKAS